MRKYICNAIILMSKDARHNFEIYSFILLRDIHICYADANTFRNASRFYYWNCLAFINSVDLQGSASLVEQ